LSHTGGEWIDRSDPNAHHEASKLNLAIDKAFHLLGWRPTWDYDETILRTAEWYQAVTDGADPTSMVSQHISLFESNASEIGNPWASTMNQSQ
jgi:CDP-glucose 4,6-dehydratase